MYGGLHSGSLHNVTLSSVKPHSPSSQTNLDTSTEQFGPA